MVNDIELIIDKKVYFATPSKAFLLHFLIYKMKLHENV